MQRKQIFLLNFDKKTALMAAIILSFMLAFVMLSTSIYAVWLEKGPAGIRDVNIISMESVFILLLNTLLFYFFFQIQFWAITRFKHNHLKMWLLLLGFFFVIAFLSPVYSQLQKWWYRDEVSRNMYTTLHYVKDLTVLIVSFLFTALIYLINENHKRVTENQNLIIENLRNRYKAIKSQTDPHFLFNSLNTLNGLIGYDDERAHEYVEQLSAVFRYTMQDHSVIKLSDELDFVDSYIYLMKIRYDDSLHVHYRIEEPYKKYNILPFALQILIENAIKHNVISLKNALIITIETTPDSTVRVENNLQPKQGERESNGLGLANLNERYRLMFGKEISIRSNDSIFAVEIPLIKNTDVYKGLMKLK